jgi:hypothetical protein
MVAPRRPAQVGSARIGINHFDECQTALALTVPRSTEKILFYGGRKTAKP